MNALRKIRSFAVGLVALFVLTACGGGESGASLSVSTPGAGASCATGASCGEVLVALTDADGDFLSYTVDVVSLSLERADGTVVDALPTRTRVDFAQYVELSELLTAATVPNGTYVGGSLRLDYTTADITVEVGGQPREALVVDSAGAPIGVRDVRVVLDSRGRLVVAPGRPALLSLDFDLVATNTVDLSTDPVTVEATPVLVAAIAPVDEKPLRLRGPLVSVDTAAGTYVVDIRPFHHPNARLGRITVHTDAATAFEIDGTPYTGNAGLVALAATGAGTPTVAFGTLTAAERRFDAQIVHAGSSVPGFGHDVVAGSILSRSGDELVVRGSTLVTADAGTDGSRFVRETITVRLGPRTRIFKDGQRPVEMLGADAPSVGQRIQAFGSLVTEQGERTLDATDGRVRLHQTHLLGTVDAWLPGQLTLRLGAIDGREVGAFDFTGTGVDATVDADPSAYEVATGLLSLPRLVAGDPVRVYGFVNPFGTAPPDFTGRTVVDFSAERAVLAIGWGSTGTTAPFLSMARDSLVLDLQNPAIGPRHTLRVGPVVLDLLALPASPQIVPAGGVQTAYVVATGGTSRAYTDFAEFVAAVTARLDGSGTLRGFTASGHYDSVSNELAARTAVALFD